MHGTGPSSPPTIPIAPPLEPQIQSTTQSEKMDRWRLCDLTHSFSEWKDPEGSSTSIPPEEILKALGKSVEEIDAARQESAERQHFEQLFGK